MSVYTVSRRTTALPTALLMALLMALALLPALAAAQPVTAAVIAPPQNVMTLASSATVEVPKDWLTIVLSTTREGSEASAVQSQIRSALDAALGEARKWAKPGQVEVRTGAFSLYPRYASRNVSGSPSITGWIGSTELVIEGRDVATLSQLAGRIPSLSIARVDFSLSREAREKVEGDVAAQAIARFRTQAEAYAKHFGFAGYTIREVQVNTSGAVDMPRPMAAAMRAGVAQAMSADLPTEAGRASVTAGVSGSVQMSVR